MINLFAVLIMIISTLLGGFGALLIKKGSAIFNFNIKKQIRNWKLISGGLFYLIANIITLYAYKLENLSVLYPIVGLSYVWAALFSKIFLKEKLNKWKLTGFGLIFLGVILMGLS